MLKDAQNFSRNSWENALQQVVTDPEELLQLLELNSDLLPSAIEASKLFPLKIPREYLSRIEKGNPHDPLLLQVLPLHLELIETPGYSKDPLQEKQANPLPGLLHKYAGRVLVTLVGICSINCRFCFRRHFPYEDNNPGGAGLDKILSYIAKDDSIKEVILSGGDPLVASDKFLQNFTDKLNKIPHVKRLRIHTRVPIVMPSRITDTFVAWIKQLKQKCVVVLHCNHPNEIDTYVSDAMQKLYHADAILLNQSVLLKGINDTPDTLINLSEKLFALNIHPYYLHALDKVEGIAHFDISKQDAINLHNALNHKLPGYLVPKLVFEQPGAPSKLSLLS